MRLRLPASPVENSLEARAFVFSGFCVAVIAIVLYGQDYVVPAAGVVVNVVAGQAPVSQRQYFCPPPSKLNPTMRPLAPGVWQCPASPGVG